VGCRKVAPQSELHRFATVEGRVLPDPRGTLPGRGAWLHPKRECWDAAVARRSFNRAFKAPVTIPPENVDFT
jgi:predicted RNA-binding protein YlxR (DUF448 family)